MNRPYFLSRCVWARTAIYFLSIFCFFAGFAAANHSEQITIPGPSGSDQFGKTFSLLPNGNFVVIDSGFDSGLATDVGAIYLYRADGYLISTLTGSSTGDFLNGKVFLLHNGNYVLVNSLWDNGAAIDAGAVTWGSGTVGVSGHISADNSLIGSSSNDYVGKNDQGFITGVVPLKNGNYIIRSAWWDNGAITDAGAVTWAHGETGISGVLSASNSLVGTSPSDQIGHYAYNYNFGREISELSNGNFVVESVHWDKPGAIDAGAVTWSSGNRGLVGAITESNSLVGGKSGDAIGSGGVQQLENGNFVVLSHSWNNASNARVGAVTWASGESGRVGTVTAENSLVGASAGDSDYLKVVPLKNGHYVVVWPSWDLGAIVDSGAATWASGTSGLSGVVSASNSLTGNKTDDWVGNNGVFPLSNGNYLVLSPYWSSTVSAGVGAVTWGSGVEGVRGVVSSTNSLVGTSYGDSIGTIDEGPIGVIELSNGNYVVSSTRWRNNGAASAGAVTWGSGVSGVTGAVSASNSLVGSTEYTRVGMGSGMPQISPSPPTLNGIVPLIGGNYVVVTPGWRTLEAQMAVTWSSGTSGITGTISPSNSLVHQPSVQPPFPRITPLSNGNYVVSSSSWKNGNISDAGAVIWGSGSSGIVGFVSTGNSLVGTNTSDRVGEAIYPLSNGNYLVSSSRWNSGAGAVTLGSGISGITGPVSAANSLVGTSGGDRVGMEFSSLTNGNFVFRTPLWDNGTIQNAGAVTWGAATGPLVGAVSPSNSLVGSSANDRVGESPLTTFANGNYLVGNANWDNGLISDAGAITFGSHDAGLSGVISPRNSLVGGSTNDRLGDFTYSWRSSVGSFGLHSPSWDNLGVPDAGAVALVLDSGGQTGFLHSENSVVGISPSSGVGMRSRYDSERKQLLVGDPVSNRIVLHRLGAATAITSLSDLPDPSNYEEPVAFTVIVTSSTSAPTDGIVTFRSNNGDQCVGNTPTILSQTQSSFSCQIVPMRGGTMTVVAEYSGSAEFAFSISAPEPHTTVGLLFRNGFE